MACGRLSYSVVRALTRVATPDNEARLVAVACCATGAQVERLVRAWRQVDREAQPDAEQVRLARRVLSTRVDEDDMLVLRARLTPEVGAVVLRALEAALEQVPPAAEGDAASSAQRRADALGLVAESALAGGLDPRSPGDRFQVTVHVETETLGCRDAASAAADTSAETRAIDPPASEPAAPAADAAAGQAVIEQAGGIHVGKEAARRVACDAGLVVLRHGPDGGVLDVGRRTRTLPTALRRALGGPGSQPVPVPRLQLTPLRRPSRGALGRRRGDPAHRPCYAACGPAPTRRSRGFQGVACTPDKNTMQDQLAVTVTRCQSRRPTGSSRPSRSASAGAHAFHVGKEAARRVPAMPASWCCADGPDGGVLDVGRRTRTLPTALRRALEGRDRNQCQGWPVLQLTPLRRPSRGALGRRRGDPAHHSVLLCRFHHRAVHEEGFQVVADAAGRFQFLRPDGAPLPALPPAPGWQGAGAPLAPTVARLAAAASPSVRTPLPPSGMANR